MFLLPIFVLFLLWLIEIFKKSRKDTCFNIGWLLLTLMLCFRFAQGTDYPEYWMYYNFGDNHSELGWVLLTWIFKSLGFSFEEFVFFISLFMMFCVYKSISIYLKDSSKCLALLLLYPTIYLTDFFNTIRLGFAIAVFLGYMLPWLEENQTWKYILCSVFLTFIQSLSLLFVPLVLLKDIKINKIKYIIILSLIFGSIIYILPISFFSGINIRTLYIYLPLREIGLLALLEKTILFLIIVFLYYTCRKNQTDKFLYRICAYGLCYSFIFVGWQLITSRVFQMIACCMILLIPRLISRLTNLSNKRIITTIIIVYVIVISSKNIAAYMRQLDLDDINIFSCPYVSVFNKEEALNINYGNFKNFGISYSEYYSLFFNQIR